MPDLYTSLTHLKMAMNGGALPPMTDIPVAVRDIIDPALTIGLGALYEDAEKGLRCPVRGCGAFYHVLSRHVNAAHPQIGGANGLMDLLEIPRSAKLASATYRAQKAAQFATSGISGVAHLTKMRTRRVFDPKAHKRGSARQKTVYASAGMRNLTNRCDAQMRHALIDLQNQIGRSPTLHEARNIIGEGFTSHVLRVYGTWNAAKARFGLDQYKRGHKLNWEIPREAVLEALLAYYEAHGTLPSVHQAKKPTRTPSIPSTPTILKALKTDSWPEAMRRAASLLNIYGGRYGLPESVRPTVAA